MPHRALDIILFSLLLVGKLVTSGHTKQKEKKNQCTLMQTIEGTRSFVCNN